MAEMADPTTYDYSQPTLSCDIVMKGGITSGVVYPHAVCELARVYRFKSVGGASAGAIAAAAAAAAECGRDNDGFARLADLPAWVGGGSNMFDLFQPQKATRGLFRTFTTGLGQRGLRKWLIPCRAALRHFPVWPLLAALPGLAVIVVASIEPASAAVRAIAIAAGVVLFLLGILLGLVARLAIVAPRAIAGNRFGLCSGMPSIGSKSPALTPWLSDLIDRLAGKTDGSPLTFADLKSHGVELTVMTTNLTQRRPQRLPWTNRLFFFDPSEWRELFPERVVTWMVDHPPPLDEDDPAESERVRRTMLPRLPLPAPDDLPVVVAARMSLSFPLLISAIPLWAFDRTLKSTNDALSGKNQHATAAVPERCWFSDGGISSNFPVHFFDAALPTRPTFAIDLDEFHRDYPKSDSDEAKNVYLPQSNEGGLLETWYRFPENAGLPALIAFVSGMVRTMQNRVDTALARQPGYRDRIVHVHTAADEGGMNLTMPARTITALTRRGQEGARLLVKRFAETPGTAPGMSWDNHRWVRYRAAVTSLAEFMEAFASAWGAAPAAGQRTYGQLATRTSQGPDAYPFTGAEQQQAALTLTDSLVQAAHALKTTGCATRGQVAAATCGHASRSTRLEEPQAPSIRGADKQHLQQPHDSSSRNLSDGRSSVPTTLWQDVERPLVLSSASPDRGARRMPPASYDRVAC